MKNRSGRVIGFELLHYEPVSGVEAPELAVETIIRARAC